MNSGVKLVSVIINNYNYSAYLTEAIESVLNQTYKDFELIIVDDGSQDNSLEIINKFADKDKRIIPVSQQNSGQANAINAGFSISKGDVIYFLDSDDVFESQKIEETLKMHLQGYDYIYTDNVSVTADNKPCRDKLKRYRYNGWNTFLVYYMSKYPGNITSCLSLTRKLAEQIFPLPHADQWRIQADDPIVFQASMLSRAFYLDEKLTRYRIHGDNGYYNKKLESDYFYRLLQKRNRLKDIASEKAGLSATFFNNSYNLCAEFGTHKHMDMPLLRLYFRVLWFEMDVPLLKKAESSLNLFKKYLKGVKSD